jgi:hypothetical protein
MNQTPGVLGATARGARWGLPWLSVLAISASVAYASQWPWQALRPPVMNKQPSLPHTPRLKRW